MSETTTQYLSRLHSSTGLSPEVDIVARRAKAIESVASKATTEQVVTAAAVATGVVNDLAKLQWLVSTTSEADPSFSPVTVDKAVAALSAALTHHVLAKPDVRSAAAALVLLSARLSKADSGGIDPSLPETAQHCLWAIQQTALPEASYTSPAQISITEQLTALHVALAANTAAPAADPLKAILEALVKADAAQGKAAADPIRALIAKQAILEEEAQMQWWVVGKASHDLLRPFADIPPFEAAARAATELANMISRRRPAGPFAAPALLERVLESDSKGKAAAQPFDTVMTGIPREARTAIFSMKPSLTVAPGVFPIMLGAEYSIDSGDEPDWKPRFARTAHIEPTVELTPIEFAKQLLRELLLWKLLSA
jgi:hypothetical protein